MKRAIKNRINEIGQNLKQVGNVIQTVSDKSFGRKLLEGNDKIPFAMREMLGRIGNERITSLEIVRNPISDTVMRLMNLVSGMQLVDQLKRQPFDTLFHLAIRINGKYNFEKEQVPYLRNATNKPNQEVLRVNEVPNVTINEFVMNTLHRMGLDKFNKYNARHNNCQVFVLSALMANGIQNNEYFNFVKQDTEFMFQHNPVFQKILLILVIGLI